MCLPKSHQQHVCPSQSWRQCRKKPWLDAFSFLFSFSANVPMAPEIADAGFFDIRFGLTFRIGPRSRPATDQEIDLVARTIVERLQQSNG